MGKPATSRVVAVFDFDHTLTISDSFAGFCWWLLRRNPWRLALVIAASPFLAPLLLSGYTRRIPIRFAVWVATLAVDHERLAALVLIYLSQHLRAPESLLVKDGLGQISMHRDAGHEVVIATGALELLVRAICDAVGLEDVVVVGSSLRQRLGGLVADQHCFGKRKIRMLIDRGYPPIWDFVYTDHDADLPLLRRAKQGFLVNPKPRSKLRVTTTLGALPNVLMWQ